MDFQIPVPSPQQAKPSPGPGRGNDEEDEKEDIVGFLRRISLGTENNNDNSSSSLTQLTLRQKLCNLDPADKQFLIGWCKNALEILTEPSQSSNDVAIAANNQDSSSEVTEVPSLQLIYPEFHASKHRRFRRRKRKRSLSPATATPASKCPKPDLSEPTPQPGQPRNKSPFRFTLPNGLLPATASLDPQIQILPSRIATIVKPWPALVQKVADADEPSEEPERPNNESNPYIITLTESALSDPEVAEVPEEEFGIEIRIPTDESPIHFEFQPTICCQVPSFTDENTGNASTSATLPDSAPTPTSSGEVGEGPRFGAPSVFGSRPFQLPVPVPTTSSVETAPACSTSSAAPKPANTEPTEPSSPPSIFGGTLPKRTGFDELIEKCRMSSIFGGTMLGFGKPKPLTGTNYFSGGVEAFQKTWFNTTTMLGDSTFVFGRSFISETETSTFSELFQTIKSNMLRKPEEPPDPPVPTGPRPPLQFSGSSFSGFRTQTLGGKSLPAMATVTATTTTIENIQKSQEITVIDLTSPADQPDPLPVPTRTLSPQAQAELEVNCRSETPQTRQQGEGEENSPFPRPPPNRHTPPPVNSAEAAAGIGEQILTSQNPTSPSPTTPTTVVAPTESGNNSFGGANSPAAAAAAPSLPPKPMNTEKEPSRPSAQFIFGNPMQEFSEWPTFKSFDKVFENAIKESADSSSSQMLSRDGRQGGSTGAGTSFNSFTFSSSSAFSAFREGTQRPSLPLPPPPRYPPYWPPKRNRRRFR